MARHRLEHEGRAPALILAILDQPAVMLATRLCLVAPFLVSGVLKLADWSAGEAEMAAVGLHPVWAFNAATLIVQLIGSLLIVINRQAWLGAGALGVFTVLTTVIAHRFWDFTGPDYGRELNSFLEHMTMAAAFILVVVAGAARQRS